MKNLVKIKDLKTDEIMDIMRLAQDFEEGKAKSRVKGHNICMMFLENSTRTRFSFEMASNNLGLKIFNFDDKNTSLSKGESIKDTVQNLRAIGIDCIVLRSKESLIEPLIGEDIDISYVNAGEGKNYHPTQALLDFYTIRKHIENLEDKKVVIVGDIKHSRVAKSNVELLSRFAGEIVLVAPDYFQDKTIQNVRYSKNLKEELKDADITMGLRIQRERIEEKLSFADYIEHFQINSKNINPKTLLMHPGPVNREIEMTSELLDSSLGKTILEQARNGVFVRMAILDMILGGNL